MTESQPYMRRIQPDGFPRRLGERLCLDFANTLESRISPEPEEFLHGFADVIKWAAAVGALTERETDDLLTAGERSPTEAVAVHARALVLRETIYRIFRALAIDESPGEQDLARLHQEYLSALSQTELIAHEDGFAIEWRPGAPSLDRAVGIVARSAVDLLTTGEQRRIKQCLGPGDDCGWLFYDLSKNARRRWCSMEGCGSQAKMRRFRARQHSE